MRRLTITSSDVKEGGAPASGKTTSRELNHRRIAEGNHRCSENYDLRSTMNWAIDSSIRVSRPIRLAAATASSQSL